MSAPDAWNPDELADTIEAERLRGRRKPRRSPVAAPPPAALPDDWQARYQRVRAACCAESPYESEGLDEHAARIIHELIRRAATRRQG